jgi:phage terminase small subunit
MKKNEVKSMALTDKQKRFIEEYLIDLNATQAAIRAGYSPKTAHEQGAQLLAKLSIRSEIDKAIAERSKRTGITQDRILRELAKVAFVNAADVINLDEAKIHDNIDRDDTAAIASVKVKTIPTEEGDIVEREVKTYDKLKALELLGKHLGMFTDKISISGDMGVKIVDDITDE